MLKVSDIRKGQVVIHEGQMWLVHESQHVAKGNKRSYMQMKFKHFKNGNVVDFRFNVDERLDTPHIEDKPFEFLYRDGKDYVLMNLDTFDQLNVSADVMPDAEKYLKGNERVDCKIVDGIIVSVELPNTVELKVVDAPPVVKGATATNQSKEAELETGYKVRVPPFITSGEMVRVDTRTGEYLSRV